MIVFRIANQKFANDLSGHGAERAGGRWNFKGHPVIYTSQSRALAAMELAVHISMGLIQNHFKIISIEIPETTIYTFPEHSLPENWKQFPFPRATQTIGTEWLKTAGQLIMKVPSVVIDGDYNFLINPFHPDFKLVKIVEIKDFDFDTRLK